MPILHSSDLTHWEDRGFVFPEGHAPSWTAQDAASRTSGRRKCSAWVTNIGSPTPRASNSKALAIGLARAPTPLGPWTDNGQPLDHWSKVLTPGASASGGVIDSHIFVDDDGAPYPVLEERYERAVAASARRVAARASRADPRSCSKVSESNAAPRSRPRSSPGRTAAARWSASSSCSP